MKKMIKWGILGTGTIATKFCTGLCALQDAQIYAVGSRTQASADRFARRFAISKAYGSYEALASDPEVDVIYIATPHTFHMENALLCLSHNKPVLCEKPFALNAAQAEKVFDLARQKNLFVMEAFWTRFQPLATELLSRLSSGEFGAVRSVSAAFGFEEELGPQGRLLNKNLAGGALLDVGIYTLSYAGMIFGEAPSSLTSVARIGDTGVDEQNAILTQYPSGGIGCLQSAVTADIPNDAQIIATKARVDIPEFWHAETAYVFPKEGQPYEIHLPFMKNGYEYEAMEVMDCLRQGKVESDILPWSHTLQIMELLDRCREQWGLQYPQE
ncbi:Gfo/Idh/MocA family protein [Zongyangia hominis]|uniref:Gfo/Idh/MocA family oxidoreductase n=1 Tax=Zongyangia hominis TaxID=2763677 RepID=A0A926EEK2_9FIRM|nr:Gfo/Idh/MocA family oxidoreductase [Zongyangia hominis]MBC8570729.1 Gfo/Idh/MocA family oxidoreductase [Zongyangia hominis]